jgi:hypothetical protein
MEAEIHSYDASDDSHKASIELKMGFFTLLTCKNVPYNFESTPAELVQDAEVIVLDQGRLQEALDSMMALPAVEAMYGELEIEGVQTKYFPRGKDGTGLPSVTLQVRNPSGELVLSITGSRLDSSS